MNQSKVEIVFADTFVQEGRVRSASTWVVGVRFQDERVVWVISVDHYARRAIFGCTQQRAQEELRKPVSVAEAGREPTEEEAEFVRVARIYHAVIRAGGSVHLAQDASVGKANPASAILVAQIRATFNGRTALTDLVQPVSPKENGSLVGIYRSASRFQDYRRINGAELLRFCVDNRVGDLEGESALRRLREGYPGDFL